MDCSWTIRAGAAAAPPRGRWASASWCATSPSTAPRSEEVQHTAAAEELEKMGSTPPTPEQVQHFNYDEQFIAQFMESAEHKDWYEKSKALRSKLPDPQRDYFGYLNIRGRIDLAFDAEQMRMRREWVKRQGLQ